MLLETKKTAAQAMMWQSLRDDDEFTIAFVPCVDSGGNGALVHVLTDNIFPGSTFLSGQWRIAGDMEKLLPAKGNAMCPS